MEVLVSPEAQAQFERLPKAVRARLLRLIARLANWPNVSGVKPLRGKLAGRFRVRTGDYRIQFFVDGNRIIIEQIGHRDGFYDN